MLCRARVAEPQAPSLPVVIGSGSHPFPFRTRKLSLIPPMVLHGKLCGRVGRCRHYFEKARLESQSGLCFVPHFRTERSRIQKPRDTAKPVMRSEFPVLNSEFLASP